MTAFESDVEESSLTRLVAIVGECESNPAVLQERFSEIRDITKACEDEGARTQHRIRFLEESVARGLQEIEGKILELSVLKQVGDLVAGAVRRPDLLEQVLQILVRELRADNSSIMLLDEVTGELRVSTGRGRHDDNNPNRESMSTLRLGEGIAGWVASRREPLLVNDIAHDIRFMRREDGGRPQGSLICIPLVGDGRVLGVLNLSTNEPGAFGNHHTRVLRIVANQIASALIGAELHRALQNFSQKLESEVAQRTQELERRSEDLHKKNDQITDLFFSLERAQAELEEQNLKLVEALAFNDSIVEALHVGIGVVRSDRRIVAWNLAMGPLSGGALAKETVLGRLVDDLDLQDRERFCFTEALEDAIRSRVPFHEHGRVVTLPSGESLHLDIRHIPVNIADEPESHVLVVIEDMTESAILHRQSVKAERLAAITETMVSVNHEVNNPLAVILGYAQILLRRLENDPRFLEIAPKARTELSRIESEAMRIREITRKLASLIEPVVTPYPASNGVNMVDVHRSR